MESHDDVQPAKGDNAPTVDTRETQQHSDIATKALEQYAKRATTVPVDSEQTEIEPDACNNGEILNTKSDDDDKDDGYEHEDQVDDRNRKLERIVSPVFVLSTPYSCTTPNERYEYRIEIMEFQRSKVGNSRYTLSPEKTVSRRLFHSEQSTVNQDVDNDTIDNFLSASLLSIRLFDATNFRRDVTESCKSHFFKETTSTAVAVHGADIDSFAHVQPRTQCVEQQEKQADVTEFCEAAAQPPGSADGPSDRYENEASCGRKGGRYDVESGTLDVVGDGLNASMGTEGAVKRMGVEVMTCMRAVMGGWVRLAKAEDAVRYVKRMMSVRR